MPIDRPALLFGDAGAGRTITPAIGSSVRANVPHGSVGDDVGGATDGATAGATGTGAATTSAPQLVHFIVVSGTSVWHRPHSFTNEFSATRARDWTS
jgi:hypothetical protein